MKTTLALLIGLFAGAFLALQFKTTPSTEPAPLIALPETVTPAEDENRIPAPQFAREDTSVAHPPVEIRSPGKTVFQRIAENDTNVFKLEFEQVHAFLARNQSNAESLLTAFNVTHDKEFLREAAKRYPSNSFVLVSLLGYDLFPEQRRELLEQFKQAAPDNPLANYLLARDYAKNQQPELALKEFVEASGKSGFHDYSVERLQGLEEIYLSSGHSAAEAKALAMANLEFPTLGNLRDIGREMSALQRQYTAAGDATSAEALAKMGLGLAGNTLSAGVNSLLSQLVGNHLEKEFLKGLDPNLSYNFLPQPVGERLTQLQAQETVIRAQAKFFDTWLATANEGQLVSYFDRLKLYGEGSALDWARTQMGEAPAP